jgi:hypothetical protein
MFYIILELYPRAIRGSSYSGKSKVKLAFGSTTALKGGNNQLVEKNLLFTLMITFR